MKSLLNAIKARINEKVPAIKDVRLFNSQPTGQNSLRNEMPIYYPACFVEFAVMNANNLAMGIIDHTIAVRFRFALESYAYEKIDTLDFVDTFKQHMHRFCPTLISGLTFTSFIEQVTEYDEDHNNVDGPFIEYVTRVRSSVSYSRATDAQAPATTENITITIV